MTLPRASIRRRVRLPGPDADLISFDGLADGGEHVALVRQGEGVPLVRVHSECLTGDVFGSHRCDCGEQLAEALALVRAEGGIVLYLRQEGRGIGLYNKIDAYALQDAGLDTYAANEALDLPADGRDFAVAAQMLAALGVDTIRLLSNNPDKDRQLAEFGITIAERVPTQTFRHPENLAYLRAKRTRMGHDLRLGPEAG
ncbi:GTP cyclohydrolase II [Naumannella huperziae]